MLRLLRVFLAIGFLHVMFEIRRLDLMLERKKTTPKDGLMKIYGQVGTDLNHGPRD
jgi:hypothetical protein